MLVEARGANVLAVCLAILEMSFPRSAPARAVSRVNEPGVTHQFLLGRRPTTRQVALQGREAGPSCRPSVNHHLGAHILPSELMFPLPSCALTHVPRLRAGRAARRDLCPPEMVLPDVGCASKVDFIAICLI